MRLKSHSFASNKTEFRHFQITQITQIHKPRSLFSHLPGPSKLEKLRKCLSVPWSNPATQGFPQITHLLAVDEEMGRRFRFSVAATTHHGQLHGSNPLRQIVLGRQAIVQKSPSRHLRFEGRVSLPNIFKAEDLLRPLVALLCLWTISL